MLNYQRVIQMSNLNPKLKLLSRTNLHSSDDVWNGPPTKCINMLESPRFLRYPTSNGRFLMHRPGIFDHRKTKLHSDAWSKLASSWFFRGSNMVKLPKSAHFLTSGSKPKSIACQDGSTPATMASHGW